MCITFYQYFFLCKWENLQPLKVATRITNINSFAMINDGNVASFLYRVGTSKLSCFLSVGLNNAYYGTFYFVKDPIKNKNTMHWILIDWLLKFLLILYFSEALLIIAKLNWLILADSIIINIIHIIHTILDIKSKHYKWNVVKLSKEAVARICTSK